MIEKQRNLNRLRDDIDKKNQDRKTDINREIQSQREGSVDRKKYM